ncbi:hypothetical protein LTS18_013941, partial [Coniosporium uncinatum]
GLTPGTCSTLSAPDTPLPIPSTGLGAAPSNDDGTGIPVDEASLFGFGDFGSSGVYSTGPDFWNEAANVPKISLGDAPTPAWFNEMGFQANGQGMGWPAVGTGVGTEVPRQAQVQKKAVTIDVNRMID